MKTTIEQIITQILNTKDQLGITLYPGATKEEIKSFERLMNTSLPNDIKKFYMFCNGFESEEDLFRIIPLDEIIYNRKDEEDNYLLNKQDFHFAEYMIYCDMWTLTITTSSDNYLIYNKAETFVTLTDDFAEFLNKFLVGGVFDGLYKWEEELKS